MRVARSSRRPLAPQGRDSAQVTSRASRLAGHFDECTRGNHTHAARLAKPCARLLARRPLCLRAGPRLPERHPGAGAPDARSATRRCTQRPEHRRLRLWLSGITGRRRGRRNERRQALLDGQHIVHQPGQNEELAATAVFGTQTLHEAPDPRYDGVFAMWYGKGPGVDRSGDAFHHHNFRGVDRHGGVLCVAGDDPQARSTIFPSDSNAAFYKFFMPLLAPGNVQEVIDFGLHGYALSRASGLWVGMKFVTDVADSAGVAEVGPERVQPVIPEVRFDGQPLEPRLGINDLTVAMVEAERRIVGGQLEMARRYAAFNGLNRIVVNPPQARLGLIAPGKTYYDLRQALRDLGLNDAMLAEHGIRILKIGMIYPLDPEIVREFADGLDEILVIEDKRPFVELFVKDILYAVRNRPWVHGKTGPLGEPLLPAHGELSADQIARALLARVPGLADSPAAAARRSLLDAPGPAPLALSTTRMPYFCSGCPHNTSLKAPEGAIVGAGIGCHIMDLWMGKGYGVVKGYTQMGGEGAQWVGLAPFTDTPHFFQNLGDGTFAHSGSIAIRFALGSKANITYKILYNSTVAMTGGQDVQGGMSVPDMVKALEAEGVGRILITTDEPDQFSGRKVGSAQVWHRDRLLEAEKLLAATPGVTVLIHVQQCATEKRRLRKRGKMNYKPMWVTINPRVCEGCGDCGEKSNCLSVQPLATEFGDKTQIHLSSCNQDLSCLKGDCPSFASVEPRGGELPVRRKAVTAALPAEILLPEPEPRVPAEAFSVCLTGIGGTGVVTVNQILGTAAFMAGMNVQTYDHTGSSQKAGPVVSHLKVTPRGVAGSPTVGSGEADLYLVFDSLVGVNPNNLRVAAPDRTIAIVSGTEVPTGEMIADRARHFPSREQLGAAIDAVTRAGHNVWLDAQAIAERLLGDHMASNLLLVGAAFQAGALPIPAEAIEKAIRLNGTAVDMNLDAFRWGRLYVSDRSRVLQAIEPPAQVVELHARPKLAPGSRGAGGPDRGTRRAQARARTWVPELIAYQDLAYATRYAGHHPRASRRGGARGRSRRRLGRVARNLYKLMAYKDEYEVARLLLADDAEVARIRRWIRRERPRSWHLHPSFLRRLGVSKKVRLGPWFAPALGLLRLGKRLRGSGLDPSGRTSCGSPARVARSLREALRRCCRAYRGNHDRIESLLSLPDMVRGYEDVKLRRIDRYRQAVVDAAAALEIDGAQGEPLFEGLSGIRRASASRRRLSGSTGRRRRRVRDRRHPQGRDRGRRAGRRGARAGAVLRRANSRWPPSSCRAWSPMPGSCGGCLAGTTLATVHVRGGGVVGATTGSLMLAWLRSETLMLLVAFGVILYIGVRLLRRDLTLSQARAERTWCRWASWRGPCKERPVSRRPSR
ncbi:MAG: indolepyruvate ferredoxin oxidoreductase family protein [Burkholderiaceae bacterium]